MEKLLIDEELQTKWKVCVRVTCSVYRLMDNIRDFIDRAVEAIQIFADKLREVFSGFMKSISNVLADKKDLIVTIKKCYPHGYPQNVDNCKVNTRGFPSPVYHCARSRC